MLVDDRFDLKTDIPAKDLNSLEYLLENDVEIAPLKRMTESKAPKPLSTECSRLKPEPQQAVSPSKFEATSLKKSILTNSAKLLEVERRECTQFEEFPLSKGRKVVIKEPEPEKSKVRPLDKIAMENPTTRALGRRTVSPVEVCLTAE